MQIKLTLGAKVLSEGKSSFQMVYETAPLREDHFQ